MRIAILGTRGIPASYSGFETAAEQLASRLTERGHEVVVYCRPHVVDKRLREYKGARLVHLPTIRNKYLDTFTHTLLSSVHAARRVRPDVALFFIAGNSPMCLITRGADIPTVINVDGLDSDRSKWPPLAKAYLRFAERNAPRWADTALTDSHAVAEVFEQRYGQRIGVVPYGVEDPGGDGSEPDVAWQCTFADMAARDADLAARAASADFESVRLQMRKLYARFERQVFAIVSL